MSAKQETGAAVSSSLSNEYFRLLVESVKDYALFMLDPNGCVASWNIGAERIKGYRLEEILGRHFSCFYPPEAQLAGVPSRALGIVRSEGRFEEEGWRVRKDGARFWASVTITAVRDGSGELVGYVKVTRDLTQRRRLEEQRAELLVEQAARQRAEDEQRRLSYLAQSSRLLSASLDYETTLNSVAGLAVPNMADWCTVHLLEEDGSLRQVAIRHTDPVKVAWANEQLRRYPVDRTADHGLAKVLRTGESELHKEITEEMLVAAARDEEHLNLMRQVRYRSLMIVPLIAQGRVLGCMRFVITESDRHYTEQDLTLAEEVARHAALAVDNARLYRHAQRLNEELEIRVEQRTSEMAAAFRELESFSYSVSHDLRAPLRTIDGFSQALLEDCEPQLGEEGKDYLRRIRGAAQRMGQLIEALLQLSRVARSELTWDWVDLSDIARNIVAELQESQPDRKVTCRIDAGLKVFGDGRLMRIVLRNLLENAWKFTARVAEPLIEVGAATVQDQLVVFVRDNGVGFDMAYVDKLFTPFQRLHSSQEFAGTGIGLATVQRVVERHGGRIWAEGKVGEGAVIYLKL